jgi:2-isopropylmalate synthase
LGYSFTRNDIDVLYQNFLQLADKKKEVEEEDLQKLAEQYQPAMSGAL